MFLTTLADLALLIRLGLRSFYFLAIYIVTCNMHPEKSTKESWTVEGFMMMETLVEQCSSFKRV